MDTVGWKEWVALQSHPRTSFSAKVDTGARTSAIHADAVEVVPLGEGTRVRLLWSQLQTETYDGWLDLPLLEFRWVRDSGGHETYRPVVELPILLGGARYTVQATVTARNNMAHAMLLGRRFLNGRFMVDVSKSYALGAPSPDGGGDPDAVAPFPPAMSSPL